MDYPVHLGVAAMAMLEVRVHKKDGTKAGGKRKRKKAELEGDDDEEQAEDTEVGEPSKVSCMVCEHIESSIMHTQMHDEDHAMQLCIAGGWVKIAVQIFC